MSTLTTYRVALDCPGGPVVLDVPSCLGPEAAGRRAVWTAVALGWGEPDEVTLADTSATCTRCAGDGELVDCPPRCDGSHVHERTYECPACQGTGEAPAAHADEVASC